MLLVNNNIKNSVICHTHISYVEVFMLSTKSSLLHHTKLHYTTLITNIYIPTNTAY
jgi:hypothetical protein